jgi:hypothetical protein
MKTIFSFIAFIILFCTVSCSKPEAPEYRGFRDFSIQNLSLDSALLHAELAFYNPNPFNMELKRGDVNVYLDDRLANHYVLDSTINIPKKDSFFVPLNLKVSPKLLLGSALKMLMNDAQIKVRLEGSVRVRRSGVGFTVPINYEVMQSLK